MYKYMYDEFVKGLRNGAEFLECSTPGIKNSFAEMCRNAADAIEELSMRLHGDEAAIAGMKREIERMIVNAPRWIPVTERLPEHEYGESTSVLAVDLYGVMRVVYYDGGNWCWQSGEALSTTRVAPITHWMPLPNFPEPPKEET